MKEESLLLLSDLQKLINQVVLIDYTIIILGGDLMLNVSAKWQRAVMLDNNINVNCFADIVTASGEKIPISDSELWANGFEVNDSTSSNGTFTIGALIAGKLKIKLNNIYEDYSKYDFDKASVTAYVSKSFSDGTTEKLKIGEYRVSETSYDGSLITLTCLDNINNFNREYDSNLSYPTTAYEVVRDACIKCDVPFTMARFDNSDYVINEIPSDNQKLTYGQVIAYILQLSGLWGKCGHDGELLIGWYDMSQFDSQGYDGGTFSTKTTPYSDGDSVDGGNFTDYSSGDSVDGGTFTEARNYHNIYTQKDLNIATDDVVITGVKVTVTSKEDKTKDVNALAGKEGYVVSISDNPFISADKAQTVANYIFKKIGGMRFRPLDATLLSNPLIESGDVALVTDRKQNTYSCFISNRTFTVGSGTKISCDAENASRNSADKFSNETKAVVQARKVVQAQLSVYDKQMQLLTQLMSQSLGLFKTEQKQEDGSIIYIMHNKADLNSSNIQWKMTADGVAVSNDYGKTWNAGIDKNGNATFNVMSAIGINFDWAHGGTLTLGGTKKYLKKNYTSNDTDKIKQIVLGEYAPNIDDFFKLDIDGNGKIDVLDATIINKKIINGSDLEYARRVVIDPSESGTIVFYQNGEATGYMAPKGINVGSVYTGYLETHNSVQMYPYGQYSDPVLSIGQSNDIFINNMTATNSTVTSDARLKKNVKKIPQECIDGAMKVDLVQYQYISKVDEQERKNFGIIAQDVAEKMGLQNNESFGILSKSKDFPNIGECYSVSYEQFLILRLAGDEQKIDKMQKHIDELGDKFSRLCQKLGVDESEV